MYLALDRGAELDAEFGAITPHLEGTVSAAASGSRRPSPSKPSRSLTPSPQYQMSPSSVLQVGLLVHDVNEDFLGGPVARLLPCCDFDLYLRIGLEEVRRDLR